MKVIFLQLQRRVPDPRSGSGMNIPDPISENLETIFCVTIHNFFDADPDPGSGIFFTVDPGWKNSDPRSGKNISDPQHRAYLSRYLLVPYILVQSGAHSCCLIGWEMLGWGGRG
jgi:hypothetical protein